jgi:hypothetical protein
MTLGVLPSRVWFMKGWAALLSASTPGLNLRENLVPEFYPFFLVSDLAERRTSVHALGLIDGNCFLEVTCETSPDSHR